MWNAEVSEQLRTSELDPSFRIQHSAFSIQHCQRPLMKRRDFVKTVAMSGMAIAASDAIGDLLAQSPKGRVLESKFKGLSDVALTEAKRIGCTYADIRFTRNTNAGVNASGGNRSAEEAL